MKFDHLESYYSGKRVFLTGHTGFKGSWMLQWLHNLGATVKGYALAPETPDDLYYTIGGDELCESVIADVRDRQRVVDEIVAFKPDVVFHLAAQPLVRLSYDIPSETFATNAIGTAHVLDGVRALDHPCTVVCITTDKVYENREWHFPYRETDELGGYDPYSASKACAELVINSYRRSFFHPEQYDQHRVSLSSARAGNVIGGGDWAKDRIIPDIVRALNNGQPVEVRNPLAVRPWQHVLEPIGGYLHLGTRMVDDPVRFATAFNFGPEADDALTVEELVQRALRIWGNGDYRKPDLSGQPHEAGLLKLDINLARYELQWRPKMRASQAIEQTLLWYREGNSSQYTQLQINAYANA